MFPDRSWWGVTLFSRHLPSSSHMKHGREASILHGGRLSCFLLCTLLLILNLRSYVTKVRLAHPRCRVIEFGCAIFKVSPHPPTPAGEVVTCMWKCAGLSGGAWLATVLSEHPELILGVSPMKYSACYSQAGSQERKCCVFVFFLLYQPFIPGTSTELGCSSSAVPCFQFTQTKHRRLLLLAEQLR